MQHLKANGIAVFLYVALEVVEKTLDRHGHAEGIAQSPGQSFAELYQERQFLYRRYADLTIDCTDKTQQEISLAICEHLNLR